MHPTLTLEGGRSFYSRDFTKANLQVAIQSIQPGTALPTRKPDLQSLLSSLIKTELVGRGKYGSLPDWRRIDSLTVADLKKQILALHGSVLGNKSNLCGELERLNRASLGHSPRSTLSPEAPPFFPADVVTDPLGLLPPQPPQSPSVPAPPPLQAPVPPQPPQAHAAAELQIGLPDGPLPRLSTAPPSGILGASVSGSEAACAFTLSTEHSANGQTDIMVNVAVGAALRVAAEHVTDDSLYMPADSSGCAPLPFVIGRQCCQFAFWELSISSSPQQDSQCNFCKPALVSSSRIAL